MELTDIVIGAVVQLAAKSASQIAAGYLDSQGEDIRANPWWSQPFGDNIPPVDDFVLDLGLPGGLLVAGMVTKQDKFTGMGVGSGLTGVATFIHDLLNRNPFPPPAAAAAPAAALPRGRYGAPRLTSGLTPKYQYGNGNPNRTEYVTPQTGIHFSRISLGTKARLAGGLYPGYGIAARGYAPTRPGESAVVRARTAAMVGPYAGGIAAPKFTPGPLRPKFQLGA